MAPTVLHLGWGFPPKITGGLDTAIAELFEVFEGRETVDMQIALPAEFDPGDRENVHGIETGSGDLITRVHQMEEEFVRLASDADIVHTNDWFGYRPGASAQQAHDIPWVTTFHSLSIERNLDPPPQELEAEQRIVDEADHLLTVSNVTRERIAEHHGGDAHVIHNGFPSVTPTGRDVKAELGIDGEMLFFVGRHTHQKGLSYLLAAVERLSREDITLVVGGTGHLTDQLKRFADALDIEDQVQFVGYVPEEELADYYASADLFVSPSLAEPFGITIVEALSVDTRVVTTDCGAAEILPDDVLVQVTPDSRAVAGGIQRGLAMDGPIEYETRTWGDVADDHEAFYREILEEA
ncbi:glycosyltransferase family 4 protein [Halapricum desulfuricans]|uniref:Glycosyltransferase n=1 Tax=Halapricum desulfuricans TaxID=2841257 RepID=A0A897NPY3_9EURY|nr:glycosyltransferase family 4 protein [Halapricum desulfuricans]QSG14818.1 Glycosyltransferase [Halapricum desulfuricans]